MNQSLDVLAKLTEAARKLGKIKKSIDFYELVFETAAYVFHCSQAVILLKETDEDLLVVAAKRGDWPGLHEGHTIHVGQDVRGRALATGTTQLVADTINGNSLPDSSDANTYEVAIPLFEEEGTVMGVLSIKGNALLLSDTPLSVFGLFGELVSTAISRTGLNAELEERAKRLVAVSKAVQITTTGTPLPEMLKRICELTMEILTPDGCSIQLCSDDRSHLVVEACCGYKKNISGIRIPKDCGVHGMAIETRQPSLSPNMADSKAPEPAPFASGYLSELAVPLVYEDQVLGVLHLGHRRCGVFSETDLLNATILADCAAKGIGASRAVSDAAGDAFYIRDHLSLLVSATTGISESGSFSELFSEVFPQVVSFLRCRRAAVLIPVSSPTQLEIAYSFGYNAELIGKRLDLEGSLPGEAYRTAETVYTTEGALETAVVLGEDASPIQLASPLKRANDVIGILFVESENPLTPTDIKTLDSVAVHLAIALEHNTLKMRLEELESSNRSANSAAIIEFPLRQGEKQLGVFELICRSNEAAGKEAEEFVETFASQTAIAIENTRLFEDTQQIYYEILRSLSRALEARDDYTRGHSERVADISKQIAAEMDLDNATRQALYNAALLHDIGKIGIRDEVLLAPRKLTASEMSVIHEHAVFGNTILMPLKFLGQIRDCIRHHHERWDGTGYPDRRKGEEIPLPSRIIAVADAYDAMTSERPYRQSISRSEAINEIRSLAGQQFDPDVVTAFLRVSERLPF
jgi:putative nucleotidyltransferase with HDIG domain